MSNIYAIKLDYNITEEQYSRLLSKTSKERSDRIQRFVFREDALRSLVGDLLVRYVISTNFQISNEKIRFGTNEYGKPFVIGMHSFHFNVSHSGDWVVCATDYQPIGIDIEKVKKIDTSIAIRFFSEAEVLDLKMKSNNDRISYFYDLWSLKESYIKMVGKGLSIPLDSFTCRVAHNQCFFSSNLEEFPVYLKQFDFSPRYKLAICQRNPYFAKDIHQIPLNLLL